jgi:membrane associated rhomboid family serine protease
MTKALKITMATYGIGGTVVGLLYIFTPREDVRKVLGASLLAVGIFVVIAARDPIRHILWVRFAILFALLFTAVSIYLGAVVRGEFRSVLDGISIHGTFAALLLILYPRKKVRDGEQAPSPARGSETNGSVMEVT